MRHFDSRHLTMKMVELLLLLFISILSTALGQQCALPESLIKPCSCYHRQIRCSGSKITVQDVSRIFRRLSEEVPKFEQRLDSFELVNSGVNSISPKMFGGIQVLNYIRLRGNDIANFSIGDFNQLFMLDVSSNKFTNIDTNTFVGLTDLRVLNMANTGLTRLRKEYFSHLRNLNRLDLSNNAIEHIDIDAFSSEYENNFQLAQLDLSGNRLTKLPENVFTVLRTPERIDLSNNRLRKINEIFNFSPDMTQFDPVRISLANNSLTSDQFSTKTFDNLVERCHAIDLDLSGNRIKIIERKVFEKLLFSDTDNIVRSRVNFGDNPVECENCAHSWLFTEPHSAMIRSRIQLPLCATTGKNMARLSVGDFSKCARRIRAQK